jgi:hypothetical protein
MKARIKQYLIIAIIVAAGYFIMHNHVIFDGKKVYLLEKDSLHLHYTFYSIAKKKPESVMQIDILREAGIGDLLVELGKITEDQKYKLESKYAYEY